MLSNLLTAVALLHPPRQFPRLKLEKLLMLKFESYSSFNYAKYIQC
jgi:hypothetical protein